MDIGSYSIDDLLTFTCNTHDPTTGAAADADSAPTYRVYEDETGTPLLTGSMALLDDANTVGFYSEQITLSAANGFEVGKCYTIRISATVGGVAGVTLRQFQMAAPVRLADAVAHGGTPGSSTATLALKSARIENTSGNALTIAASGSGNNALYAASSAGNAMNILGGGNGQGVYISGGTNGNGLYLDGGSTDGTSGLYVTSQAANGNGIKAAGTGTGFDLQANNLQYLVNKAVDTDFATTVHIDSVIGHLADVGSPGFFARASHSLMALRNRGDIAWTTVAASTIRSAVGLASANLDTQLAALSSQISAVDSIVDAILDDTGTSGVLVASAGLNNVVPADPSAIPVLGTANIVQWIGYFGAWTVNRVEVTETEATLRNSANSADLATHALSDDDITFISDEPT